MCGFAPAGIRVASRDGTAGAGKPGIQVREGGYDGVCGVVGFGCADVARFRMECDPGHVFRFLNFIEIRVSRGAISRFLRVFKDFLWCA